MLQVLSMIRTVLRNDRGIETLEWILIGALVTGVGMAIFPTTLTTSLRTAVTTIGATITGAA
jgi:Flp pilus assembly pilin Flp